MKDSMNRGSMGSADSETSAMTRPAKMMAAADMMSPEAGMMAPTGQMMPPAAHMSAGAKMMALAAKVMAPAAHMMAAAPAAMVPASQMMAPAPKMMDRHNGPMMDSAESRISYGTLAVGGINIAFREAGVRGNPQVVLLHGFPSSSHQYRDLIRSLAETFHVIAPDYPGFGLSDIPDPASYAYTFDGLADTIELFLSMKGFRRYGMFVQDYGGPVGMRIAGRNPEALEWLIVQNSNAYEVGFTSAWDGFRGALWKNRSPETEKPLAEFLTHDAIKSIYLFGSKDPNAISPDNWESDFGFMQRQNAVRVNLDLFYDYRKNVDLYPRWQAFLRDRQPKTLIFWAQTDIFFTPAGGEAFLTDLPEAEMHRIEAGHFAVEDHLDYIAKNMVRFYHEKVASQMMMKSM